MCNPLNSTVLLLLCLTFFNLKAAGEATYIKCYQNNGGATLQNYSGDRLLSAEGLVEIDHKLAAIESSTGIKVKLAIGEIYYSNDGAYSFQEKTKQEGFMNTVPDFDGKRVVKEKFRQVNQYWLDRILGKAIRDFGQVEEECIVIGLNAYGTNYGDNLLPLYSHGFHFGDSFSAEFKSGFESIQVPSQLLIGNSAEQNLQHVLALLAEIEGANENFAKRISLLSVGFKEDNGLKPHPVKLDDGSLIDYPQWIRDGYKKKNSQICFIKGSKLELDVNISFKNTALEKELQTGQFNLRAMMDLGNSWKSSTSSRSGTINESGLSIDVDSLFLNDSLPNIIGVYDAKITFEYSVDNDSTWTMLEEINVVLYATFQKLEAHLEKYRKRYLIESILHLSCNAAKGSENGNDIFDGIWSVFEFSDEHGSNDKLKTRNGKKIKYYNPYFTELYTARDLLESSDKNGQCGSMADLLKGMLAVQGVTNQDIFVKGENDTLIMDDEWKYIFFFQKDMPPENESYRSHGFLVKDWSGFENEGTSGDTIYPYFNGRPYLSEDKHEFETTEIYDEIGLAGQNSPNPTSMFNNHQVLFIRGKYFDPSYGKVFESLKEIQEMAIAGFWKVKEEDSEPGVESEFQGYLIQETTDSLYLDEKRLDYWNPF